MNTIALVGASSQIAKDLIRSLSAGGETEQLLYVRRIDEMSEWLRANGCTDRCSVHDYLDYGSLEHGAVINFVGVGDPRRAVEMGASILQITSRFDDLVLSFLEKRPDRRYLFLSSGAAYGGGFAEPVTSESEARIAINCIAPQDFYSIAKLHAEVKHRSMAPLSIVDLRVFNYFSRTQDVEARFLITDIVRAVRDGQTLQTSPDYVVRDFLHPADFHQLVTRILDSTPRNVAIDCYSKRPVDKPTLLQTMQARFGLRYETGSATRLAAVNATGYKPYYYSLSRKAAEFGYCPAYTSLDGVIEEAAAMLA